MTTRERRKEKEKKKKNDKLKILQPSQIDISLAPYYGLLLFAHPLYYASFCTSLA